MIDFTPHPEIAVNDDCFDPAVHKAVYQYNYQEIFKQIADGKLDKRSTYRMLFLNDLFFMVCFGMQIEKANHPFVVKCCHDVQTGPASMTLDIWAREHFKSTVITQAETIQYHLKNPDSCTAIFAYVRPAAKAFLRSIKILCETSELLKWCFPDVLWQKPEVEAPKWSEDDGLIFKRTSNARKESTIEAWGLIEGMPTGRHFERRVYDDVETDDIKDSPDMLTKCYSKFEMSDNLGIDNGVERVIGTYYSHFGPMLKIRDKQDIHGKKMYFTRLKPATENGERNGSPVLISQDRLDKLKMSPHFNSQQLCDPTPISEAVLNPDYLKPIDSKFIPRTIYKFMVLDQAGGDETKKQSKDLWSYGVVGIEPSIDDIGQSNVYLLDIEADKMSHSEGIDGVVRMYLRNGIINQMGVEKVGLSTTEIHITNALRVKGRRLSLDAGNLILLSPAGRSKNNRINNALQWPLNNGKIFYSKSIPQKYIDSIIEEMRKFPFYHVDILDMLAYSYDLFKEFKFPDKRAQFEFNRPLHLAQAAV
jgi:hypothetical protein